MCCGRDVLLPTDCTSMSTAVSSQLEARNGKQCVWVWCGGGGCGNQHVPRDHTTDSNWSMYHA